MNDINDQQDSPLLLKISFDKLLKHYEKLAQNDDPFLIKKAQRVLEAGDSTPELREGFSDPRLLETYQKEINIILEDSFNALLSKNEIKTASMPLHWLIFNSSDRFKSIIKYAGSDFNLKISNMPDDDIYRMACTIILYFYYGHAVNFKMPLYYEIPDSKQILRTYKILYNVDFAEVIKTERAPLISEEDYYLLLNNFEDIELWRQKFPPQSYIFKGFTINNIFNVTEDRSISDIKSTLLISGKRSNKNFIKDFQETFESLFDIKNLKIGFVVYNKLDNTLERIKGASINSYLLPINNVVSCKTALCMDSYQSLVFEKEYYSVADVESTYKHSQDPFYENLFNQGIKSAIFAPLSSQGELLGVLEIVSNNTHELNSINANLLTSVMPFIITSFLRSKKEEEHLIEAVIQQECTSIHPSVSWKFEDAARDFLDKKRTDTTKVAFEEITFKDVYPLFGQIDVKGSSEMRNVATLKDLSLQLNLAKEIIDEQFKIETFPAYEQLNYQLKTYLDGLKYRIQVDSEQEIADFFVKDIHPLFEYLQLKNDFLKIAVSNYFSKVNLTLGLIYFYRKKYDDTINLINKNMSQIIDENQVDAQRMYPHYFERYKTDGVEHNMYVGASITQDQSFNIVYLYNLRLWQLQVLCEMENEFYKNKDHYPAAVDVASMVLVFHQPLTIQFRLDEKRFDVYGTYNARYEVIKKRVEKAVIKGTNERITVKGKLTIIYFQKEDEIAYLKYIKYLQFKNVFGAAVELLDLEDLQGVTGLKAIRVPIVYNQSQEKHYYTYEDLVSEIND